MSGTSQGLRDGSLTCFRLRILAKKQDLSWGYLRDMLRHRHVTICRNLQKSDFFSHGISWAEATGHDKLSPIAPASTTKLRQANLRSKSCYLMLQLFTEKMFVQQGDQIVPGPSTEWDTQPINFWAQDDLIALLNKRWSLSRTTVGGPNQSFHQIHFKTCDFVQQALERCILLTLSNH